MTEDEQHAESSKYCAPRVVALPSGRFALFGNYANDELPLRSIVSFEELHAKIIEQTLFNVAPPPPPPSPPRLSLRRESALDLLDLL